MIRALVAALSATVFPVFGGGLDGRVIEVSDGATLTVLSRQGASIHRVRIAGIGAPASKASDAGSSRAGLRRLVSGKTVRVEANALDPKGVLVGSVHVVANDCIDPCPPLVDPGLVQLANGMAVIDKTNLSWQSSGAQERYLSAQAQAKAGRLGVWRDPRYEPGR